VGRDVIPRDERRIDRSALADEPDAVGFAHESVIRPERLGTLWRRCLQHGACEGIELLKARPEMDYTRTLYSSHRSSMPSMDGFERALPPSIAAGIEAHRVKQRTCRRKAAILPYTLRAEAL
jgi:hypothetical protein